MIINKNNKELMGYRIFKCFNTMFMLMIVVVALVPYLNVFAKAFNDGIDGMRGGITIFPRVPTIENFRTLFDDTSFYRAALITITRVILAVVLNISVQITTAFVLTRKGLWGTKIVNIYFLIPMFLSGGLIPQYLLYSKLDLLNTFWVYIIPGMFSFYNVMIMRSYISMSIPDSIVEAAKIDGANDLKVLVGIILPLCKPILATIALWTAVANWNDWTTTLMFIQKPNLQTLQYKLMQIIKESDRIVSLIQAARESGEDVESLANSIKVTPESLIAAQVVVVTLPIIMVYPFLQKYFVKGVMLGSVKE